MDPSGATACASDFRLSQTRNNDLSNAEFDRLVANLEKTRHGWRRIVTNFTPSWFAVTMGTGIVSILLHDLPYNARWLYWLSVIVFALNVVLFVTFSAISVVRYTLYPGIWTQMLRHPVQSLFLGEFGVHGYEK
jgi:uncharacterized membrane protein YcjF (UPF0283 family)